MDIPFKKTKCEAYKHYQCAKLFGVQKLSIELFFIVCIDVNKNVD